MAKITIQIEDSQLQTLLQLKELHLQSFSIEPDNAPSPEQPLVTGPTVYELFEDKIRKLRFSGSQRTLDTFRGALKKFRQFMGDEDIQASGINSDLIEAYQGYLKSHELSVNTISFYLRKLRVIYNIAVDRELIPDGRPFRHVFTGMAKTAKRAISVNEIRRIKSLSLDSPRLQFSRDMFLFSFYTRGMAFIDMANLKKSDIKNGTLIYKRHKTSQTLSMKWEPHMQEIVDRYPSATHYLLPIIQKLNGRERGQYLGQQSKINADLKVIAKQARVTQNLTMYCARHSWASIAYHKNVPLSVISRGMGHTSERTTGIYLKSIDLQTVDKANRQILDLLK